MAERFDKFTERARRVLSMALQEAQNFGHAGIDTEHILLALIAEGEGIAVRVLFALGGQLPAIRKATIARIEQAQGKATGEVGLTPRAKEVIELAVDEARRLNHHYIGTEHLLLALTRVRKGIAAEVLLESGIDHDRAVEQVIAILSTDSGDTQRRTSTPTQPQSPELREALEQLEQLRQQEYVLRARISEMQRSARRRGTLPSLSQQPTEPIDFDHFTERAKRVLTMSQEEAQRFNHNYIGTEHILLGLVREGDGVAARVLANLGIFLPDVRSAVEFIIGRGPMSIMGEIGLTPRAKTVLALAVDESWRLNHTYIGTEHLLLGLVREGEGIAAGVLVSKGVRLEQLRAQVIQVLSGVQSDEIVTPPTMTTVRPQSPARTPEEIAARQTPRGRLLQVIPIVQEQTQGSGTFVGVAIERYENIFTVNWQFTVPRVERHPYPHLAMSAEDDRGNHYRSFAAGGSSGSSPEHAFEWHVAYRFYPALAPAARSLSFTIALQPGHDSPDITPTTWTFTVAIPPLPAG